MKLIPESQRRTIARNRSKAEAEDAAAACMWRCAKCGVRVIPGRNFPCKCHPTLERKP